jgi:hypothetical protein
VSDNARIVFVAVIIAATFLAICYMASVEGMRKAGTCGTPIRIEACK